MGMFPLTTPSEYICLYDHGYFKYFDQFKDRLLAIAKGMYQRLKARNQILILRLPAPSDCGAPLEMALDGHADFVQVIEELCTLINYPNPKDPSWQTLFLPCVAHNLLDDYWPISS
jgi:hypothetical protein